MGIGIRVFPGVRISASSRGVRAGIGPRAARVHVGSGGVGLSTGAGPVTLWSGTRGRQYSRDTPSVAAYEREVRRSQRGDDLIAVAEANLQLTSVLRLYAEEFAPVGPVRTPAEPVDRDAIVRAHVENALHGISPLKLGERRVARQAAEVDAEAAIARLERERDAERAECQRGLDAAWTRLQANEPETVLAALEAAFEDNEFPAAPLDCADQDLFLLVTLPERDAIVPERKISKKLRVAKRTETARNTLFLAVMASAVVATCKEAFAVAPGAQHATVLVIRKDDRAQAIEPLAVVAIDRQSINDLTSGAIGTAVHLLNGAPRVLRERGAANELVPIDPTAVPGLPAALTKIADGLGYRVIATERLGTDDLARPDLGDAAAAVTRALKPSTTRPANVESAPMFGDEGNDITFSTYDSARRGLVDEYAAATTPDEQYEAVCMISWLHEQQMNSVQHALDNARELPVGDRGRLTEYIDWWLKDAKLTTGPLVAMQNLLVDQLGRARCQEIVERVTPRLEAIKQETLAKLDARVIELLAQQGLKACPDCAEEIKIEARVCRFCGLRFGDTTRHI